MIKKFFTIGAVVFGLLFTADAALIWGIAHNQPDLPTDKADAIVVLGAAINTPALRNRTLEALEIYEQGKAERLILSGGKIADPDMSEAASMAKIIDKNAQGDVDYILEDQSHNTYDNIKNSQAKLAEVDAGADSIIIVSDSFHLARAVLLAKRAGFEEVYWNSPSSGYYRRDELRYYYMREFVAMINYLPKFIFG
jgi:uncharacterized SAM-binding protein YcdF (DUF218 family)